MPPTRIDAARGAMLGTFTGDALGMPFEGKPPNEIPQRLEMIDGRLPRGSYTDDTQNRDKDRSHVERLAAQLASPVLSRDPKRQPRRE